MSSRSAQPCDYDIVSLGEVMLRFDPGQGRIHTNLAGRGGTTASSTYNV